MKIRLLSLFAVLTLSLFFLVFALQKRSDPARILGSSMEPGLRGPAFLFHCSSCRKSFRITCELSSRDSESAKIKDFRDHHRFVSCPYCGYTGNRVQEAVFTPGIPLTLSKISGDSGDPHRFSIGVFKKDDLLYIKRIVGLPGERVSIHQGDLWINGRIFRKDPDQLRLQSVPLVHIRKEKKGDQLFFHYSKPAARPDPGTAVEYIDLPITNQSEVSRMENEPFDQYEHVRDFILHLSNDPLLQTDEFALLINRGRYHYLLKIQSSGKWEIQCRKANSDMKERIPNDFIESIASKSISDRRGDLSIYSCDERLTITLNRKTMFQIDLREETDDLCPISIPFILSKKGEGDKVFDSCRFEICRDLHYTSKKGDEILVPNEEYYVLGDHSPVSIDSRNWDPPTISAKRLIGIWQPVNASSASEVPENY